MLLVGGRGDPAEVYQTCLHKFYEKQTRKFNYDAYKSYFLKDGFKGRVALVAIEKCWHKTSKVKKVLCKTSPEFF